jgi:hypothetical protein
MNDTRAPLPSVPAAKPWYASRTIWFNGVAGVVAAAESSMGMLQPVLGANAYAALTFIVLVGNALLRAVTTQPITVRRSPQDSQELL